MKRLRITKWWWAWNYEEMEAWLEEMEQSGYKLDKVGFFGIVFYFTNSQPKQARYCIDYQHKITPEYLNLLQDDGWQLYQMGAGWYVCRKEYQQERPHLFSDYDSAIERNQKLIGLMLCCFAPLISTGPILMERLSHRTFSLFSGTVIVLYILMMMFYIFSLGKLMSTIKLLKIKKEISQR